MRICPFPRSAADLYRMQHFCREMKENKCLRLRNLAGHVVPVARLRHRHAAPPPRISGVVRARFVELAASGGGGGLMPEEISVDGSSTDLLYTPLTLFSPEPRDLVCALSVALSAPSFIVFPALSAPSG